MFKMFSTRLSWVQFAAFLAATPSAFILSACAGGVGEETNSIVGAAEDDQSVPTDMLEPQVTAPGSRDSVVLDTVSTPQSSDKHSNLAIDELDDTVSITIPAGSSFFGKLYNNNGQILNISVKLPEGTQQTQTDSLGYFTLNNLPDGTYPMFVSTGNAGEVAYLLQNGTYGNSILGPVSVAAVSSLTASNFKAPPVETIYYDGEADEQPSAGNEPSPETDEPSDSIAVDIGGKEGAVSIGYTSVEYGYVSVVATNELPNDINYGVVKHWSTGIKNGSTEADQDGIAAENAKWSVEVQFQLNSVDTKNRYIKNIFGQFGDEENFFSLALINGECGTAAPSLAFFVGKHNEFSCNSAVVSAAEVKANEALSVTVSVNNGMLKLYKNGFLIANNYADYSLSKSEGVPPFVFGEQDFDVKLNDVRLGETELSSVDVLYRYYQ